jgi:hypothetical protein
VSTPSVNHHSVSELPPKSKKEALAKQCAVTRSSAMFCSSIVISRGETQRLAGIQFQPCPWRV